MQDVHAWTRLRVPPTSARTVWMFGFQRRRVRRWECEMLLPKPGRLPQTSQLAATGCTLQNRIIDGPRRTPVDARRWPGRGQTIADPAVAGPTGVRHADDHRGPAGSD